MIYRRKIRPLSELNYAVCLLGLWLLHHPAHRLHSGCRASRLVSKVSQRRGGIRVHRDQVLEEIVIGLLVMLSAQISVEAHIQHPYLYITSRCRQKTFLAGKSTVWVSR